MEQPIEWGPHPQVPQSLSIHHSKGTAESSLQRTGFLAWPWTTFDPEIWDVGLSRHGGTPEAWWFLVIYSGEAPVAFNGWCRMISGYPWKCSRELVEGAGNQWTLQKNDIPERHPKTAIGTGDWSWCCGELHRALADHEPVRNPCH